jgi:hypothetical protein
MEDLFQRRATQVYDRYVRLSRAMTERYRLKINAADPRVGFDGAFHLTHNWGNDAARAVLASYHARWTQLLARRDREYSRVRSH